MITELILFVLEIVGTVAFAVSGAMVAIKSKFDVFGVIVVGCITAVGGGITRDLIVGQNPPLIFNHLFILGIAALTSLAVFAVAYSNKKRYSGLQGRLEKINNYFDAAGLSAFTVMGVELAFSTFSLWDRGFLAISLGVLTGVGGGVLRDVLTEHTPYIFTKHIYAIASIAGAVSYYVMRLTCPNAILPTLVGLSVVFSLRMLATKYRWSLPKIELVEEDEEKK